MLVGALLPLLAAAAEPQTGNDGYDHPRNKTLLKRRFGVEVLGVRLAAAGTMLEFRYRVLEPDKAAPLVDRRIDPSMLHLTAGTKLGILRPPKTGPLRSTNPPEKGRSYWMFFGNPSRFVRSGDEVEVTIGDFRAGGLVVQGE